MYFCITKGEWGGKKIERNITYRFIKKTLFRAELVYILHNVLKLLKNWAQERKNSAGALYGEVDMRIHYQGHRPFAV